jgi:hypothetical protein
MKKRGQVALFVVIGIVVLAIVILVGLYMADIIKAPSAVGDVQKQLDVEMRGIEQYVDECVTKETNNAIELLIDGGGVFEPSNVVNYHGREYRVLCQAMEVGCLSTPVVKGELENILDSYLEDQMRKCIVFDNFEVELIQSTFDLETSVNEKNLVVELVYPITVSKGDQKRTIDEFTTVVDVPLGEMVGVVNDILNSEAEGLNFDPLLYGLNSMGKDTVIVKKPYPNKIFYVNVENSGYEFSFAIKGSDRFA